MSDSPLRDLTTPDDYVLGCHSEELKRLGRQHSIWREDCQAGWIRAGFSEGQHLLDLGCGPGFASLDLAALVGDHGRVLGIDASDTFINHPSDQACQRGLRQLEGLRLDLAQNDPHGWSHVIPAGQWDGVWCRWLAMFLPTLDPLPDLIVQALRPGGRLILHEYLRWDTFSLHPEGAALACFVERCITHWRRHGGDPDVASRLPALLEQRGLQLVNCRSLIACSSSNNAKAIWLRDFLASYPFQLMKSGNWSLEEQKDLEAEVSRACQQPSLWMTPGLVEMIWEKP